MHMHMHIESEIKKWGNSFALRITGAIVEAFHLKVGTKVDIEITEDTLIIRPPARKNWNYHSAKANSSVN